MRLADKVAIISGASNGMGAEEARLFAREGARVVIADIVEVAHHEQGGDMVEEIGQAVQAVYLLF